MPIAKLSDIKNKYNLDDEDFYYYTSESGGKISIMKVSDYEILAEESLKSVYDEEPDGLWESCLEN
jgi:hypothetical protein